MLPSDLRAVRGALLLCLASILFGGALSAQTFSHIISFQGRLCDTGGKPLPDGSYSVQFTIYDAPTAGTALWQETQAVNQAGGVFVAHLGTVQTFPSDLFTGGDRWLGIKVGDDPEMAERIRLTPSPWAIFTAESAHADEADHASSADSATNADHADEADNAANAAHADDADKVDGIHASSLATPGYLLSLDGGGLWPLSTIPQGHGSGLDADMLDGLHASDFWTKEETTPFVELAPLQTQSGAAVNLAGTSEEPTLRVAGEGLALDVESTDEGNWSYRWEDVSPATSPHSRTYHAMAYDRQSDRVILFGGSTSAEDLGDTWAYDSGSGTWTRMSASGGPSARRGHAMAYDAESDLIVLYGGRDVYGVYNHETWVYNYTYNSWTQMSPTTHPPGLGFCAMAYDSESDRVILFGGYPNGGGTWAYDCDTNTWTQMSPPWSPSARYGCAMAYDSESDRIILYGGTTDGSNILNDTWAYDYNTDTWSARYPAFPPPIRQMHSMCYHPASDQVVLFGGYYSGGYRGDTQTYRYNLDSWWPAYPPLSPSARGAHAMAYDDVNDQFVLFGGISSSGYMQDTWTLRVYRGARVAVFSGGVRIVGDLEVVGEKNAVVPTQSFGERKVYCTESTEVWFEHIGRVHLVNGVGMVNLDPLFLETVTIDAEHPMEVFITPYCRLGDWWVEPGAASFTIRTADGTTCGDVAYRVVAKRKGLEDAYLEPTGRKTR
jgi:hypothetical protein